MLAWMPSKCILKCFRDSIKAPGLSALPWAGCPSSCLGQERSLSL